MKKLMKVICVVFAIVGVFHFGELISDRISLNQDLIRLHVVANSNTQRDQETKLRVKDGIVAYLEPIMQTFSSKEEAQKYLQEHLSKIEAVANDILVECGEEATALVTLAKEEFDTRYYDTFTLPAGVYDSLRIQLGDAKGKNWWCVVFPTLCLPASASEFQDTAVSVGFDDKLASTLTEDSGYEIRFFLLDCMGRLENIFHKG